MNTDAHHSGKAHSTHGFSRASATHGRYTQEHNHKARHGYTTVTASETQHGYTRSHSHKHKAQHGYTHSHSLRNTARVHTQSQPQKHSTGTHGVTATKTQYGDTKIS